MLKLRRPFGGKEKATEKKDWRVDFYIKLTARGIPAIHDGREFIISVDLRRQSIIGRLKPPIYKEGDITFEGRAVSFSPVTPDTSLTCPKCGSLLKPSLLEHDVAWMKRVFYCPCSRYTAYLDFFPKLDPFCLDTAHSWENAFYGFGVPDKLPEGLVITDYVTPREDYLRLKKSPLKTYILTPEGIQKR